MTEKRTLNDLLLANAADPGSEAGFEIIDQYVELELAGKVAADEFPGHAAHLALLSGVPSRSRRNTRRGSLRALSRRSHNEPVA